MPTVPAAPAATAGVPLTTGALVGRELLLSGEDVPPGYQEVYQRLDQLNIDTRVFVRPDLAGGVWLIGSVVYVGDEVLPPMTARDAEQFRSEFIRGLLLGMRGLEVRDWEPVAGAGAGEQELAYRFSYEWENDAASRTGVGAMTLLVRGRVQSILMAMSADESAIDDVRRYARIADARVEQALRRTP